MGAGDYRIKAFVSDRNRNARFLGVINAQGSLINTNRMYISNLCETLQLKGNRCAMFFIRVDSQSVLTT